MLFRSVGPSLPDLFAVVLAFAAFIAVWRFDLNLIAVVLAGGAFGLLRAFAPVLWEGALS